MARLSSVTKDRLKKLAPAIIAFAVVTLVATLLYSFTSRTSNVDVWAVGTGVAIQQNTIFGSDSLRVVSIPSDKDLVAASVPVSDNDFLGTFTALRDLPPGSLLSNSDFVPGTPSDDRATLLMAESPNRMVMDITVTVPASSASEIIIPQGNIQLVTDTIPPAHIACVQFLEGQQALVDPKDFTAISLWQATGRMQTIQQTADACPVGGQPRLCGILTNASDPADLLPPDLRAEGYVYVEEDQQTEGSLESELSLVELPRCRVDNGSGVFDGPVALPSDICQKITIPYLEDVLGVPREKLSSCGEGIEGNRNPTDDIQVPSPEDVFSPFEIDEAELPESDTLPPGETFNQDGTPAFSPGDPA